MKKAILRELMERHGVIPTPKGAEAASAAAAAAAADAAKQEAEEAQVARAAASAEAAEAKEARAVADRERAITERAMLEAEGAASQVMSIAECNYNRRM